MNAPLPTLALETTEIDTSGDPTWYRDAVIYQLNVKAFFDSNDDGVGDFKGVAAKLDYVKDLGVNTIWLMPFYPSPLRDDGYDIADYRVVNPDYGTMASFKRCLSAAHERNLKVITELVVNHTSDQHVWFQRSRRAARGSRWRNYYVWTDDPQQYSDARIIFQDFEHSNWTWDPVAGQYYWHRFYSHQPDLNFDNPEVEASLMEVLEHWLDLGVDGLRLDAVPYLYEREGTNCENLPETHAFLRRLRAHMDDRYDDRMLLAEANQWPEDAAAYFGAGDECHMNFHFPLMPRMFMSVQAETRMPIVDILEQTPPPPPGAQWATFLRNHDELTLEMVTDEERDLMLRAYARDSQMRINLGIRRRLAPLLGNDRRKVELLNALLFSLPGTPVIYYGDEIGMGDNVYLGDRDGVRTPMQWSADRNGGFSTCNPHRLYLPLITEQGFHYESVNVEAQSQTNASLLSWMKQLIALRKRLPVLGRGDIRVLDPENPHVLAFVRTLEGEQPFLCVANLSRLAQHVEIDLRSHMGFTPVEVFGRTKFATVAEGGYHLTLAPYGFFWFVLDAPVSTTQDETPVGLIGGAWRDVLRRRPALARALTTWLPDRRWFSAKERILREVSVEDVIPLRDSDPEVALIIARASFTDGDDHRYAIPILHATGQVAATATNLQPGAIIARLDDGVLLDAMAVPEGVEAIVAAALTKKVRVGRPGQAQGFPRRTGLARTLSGAAGIHVLTGEQSNSSAILDGTLIAKLVRRLEPSRNPDVELPDELTRDGFAHVPGVAATLEVDLAGETEPASVLIVHDAITNEGDLWAFMQDVLSREIDQRAEANSSIGEQDSSALALAGLLGRRTAQLHVALAGIGTTADADFSPQPFTLLYQRSLLQSLRGGLRATQRALRNPSAAAQRGMGDAGDEHVERLRRHPDELLARFERLRDTKMVAQRIRIHGDLHLGQILWTGHDVVFIDFEGEPSRAMSQRLIKRSPLVDVAGLLRSIDYAGRSAVVTAIERGVVPDIATATVDEWRRGWVKSMQRHLLDEYLLEIAPSNLIPVSRPDINLMLDLFVLEKVLYEIRYELGNRPEWVGWPLTAAAELSEKAGRR
ncbi:MAG: alpha amylase, catalytic subdomain [Ilumatobacteraceae bacterium]|nr:alpha amylase, catalytic subdomain [Ilumatobacteraceae bacterium]